MSNEFSVGERVQITVLPPYLKTAETMPMLRPPNMVKLGEEGTVLKQHPGGYWSVRFTKGAFLIESQYIAAVRESADDAEVQEGLNPGQTQGD